MNSRKFGTCKAPLTAAALWLACAPALGAEPPLCADQRALHHLKQAYEVSPKIGGLALRWKSVEAVREIGLRDAAPSVNQFAPTRHHFDKSRFCEAKILFENGASDMAYFRMDGRKDRQATDFNFDPCFLRHDVLKNSCADQRISVQ